MKAPFFLTDAQNGPKRIALGFVLAVAVMFPHQDATAASPLTVDLGSASSFAILAGTPLISDAGGASAITGNVGLSPASGAGIGLLSGQVNGTIYAVDAFGPLGSINNPALLTTAKSDLTVAYNDAFLRIPTTTFLSGDNQLGGQTLFPGVYRFGHATTANLIGNLTLDANGEVDPIWIFQATSDLITAAGAPSSPGSSVTLTNGATQCDVFWEVGSSATIGTYSDFTGNILALTSIALQTGATLDGSALARNGAVTLDHNIITLEICSANVPDTGSTLLLLGSGLATLLAFRRQFFSAA